MHVPLTQARLGCRLAVAVGIADVSIALLQRPEGFASIGSVGPAVAATTTLVLGVFLLTVWPVRWAARVAGLHAESASVAWAACVGAGIVVGLLAGVQTSFGPSPQVLFRLALSGAVGVAVGAGAYAAAGGATGRGSQTAQALVGTLPVLLLQLLVAEWLGVYAIESIASIGGLVLLGALGVAVVVTLTVGLAASSSRAWGLAPAGVVLVLILGPLAARVVPSGDSPVSGVASVSGAGPQRIVLLTIDALRADAISAYRPDARPTPAIDRLAAEGLLFEHAYAPAPWTLPALTSILTGLAPAVHQNVDFTSRLSGNATTVAEHLRARGYQTAAIVHNDLLVPSRNLAQGFTDYLDLHEPWFAESMGATLLQRLAPRWFPPRSWPSTADHTQVVIDWISRHRDEPFFLWVHYFDPHAPYSPPEAYLEKPVDPGIGPAFEGQKVTMEGVVVPSQAERRWIRSLYDSEVRYVDENVGRLVDSLKGLGLYDDTLIVLTSDHGEEFWEHGSLGHGHTMFGEVLQVPLIVRSPRGRSGGRVAEAVSTTSLTPTILDLAGIEYSPADLSASSLAPALHGTPLADAPVISTAQMLFDRRETVRFGGYRYVVSRIDGQEALFDLGADPGETRSVVDSNHQAVAAGRALLSQHLSDARALGRRLSIGAGATDMDAETRRRLRSLGYIR